MAEEFIYYEGDDAPESAIAMPFVTVSSKGGPHDDQSYTCGYEMGYLDATLDALNQAAATVSWEVTIHSANLAQADLVGMQYGLTMELGTWDATIDAQTAKEWARVRFHWPVPDPTDAPLKEKSRTCPVCGMTSYHPMDVDTGYCGNCNDYT